MNVGMIPKDTLDKIANFSVSGILEEGTEISLLGTDFSNAISMNKKTFWGAYRRCLKQVKDTK